MSQLYTLGVPLLSGITSLTVIQVLQAELLRQLSGCITANIIFRQICGLSLLLLRPMAGRQRQFLPSSERYVFRLLICRPPGCITPFPGAGVAASIPPSRLVMPASCVGISLIIMAGPWSSDPFEARLVSLG